MKTTPLLSAALATALAGCATVPVPEVRRSAEADTVPEIRRAEGEVLADATPSGGVMLQPGTGRVINEALASQPPPALPQAGEATFNFEGESLHAVVKLILGDLLQQNYVIAPTVQGTVTLGTPRPVSPAQALALLEMVLGWNNARLIWSEGRYAVVPADQAVAGNLPLRTGSPATARGFELRAVPLQYVSVTEMEKLLKPYVRQGAVVQTDTARNLIVLGGTRSELENYLRTVRIFDVDWLKGMSVGVFPIQSSEAEKIVAALERTFGPESGTPLAGMFRFLPVQGSNSIIVITPQREYLQAAREWIERLDMAGEGARLYVYEVKYMKAGDLASQLGTVFDAQVNAGGSGPAPVSPGLTPVEVGAVSRPPQQRSQAPAAGSAGGTSLPGGRGGESGIGISAIEESNALMVRASPAQWESIRRAIERLDVMPAQVHIEAQVLEVALTGSLSYGVNWFFDNAVPAELRGLRPGRGSLGQVAGQIASGASGGPASLAYTFTSADAAAIVNALDSASDVRVLSTPSVFVRNNAEANLTVGQDLAVESTTFNPGTGTGNNVISNIQYLRTGTTLKVRPRIGGDGMVFLEISQTISSPSADPGAGGNPNVSTREVTTEAMVQDGETVMLAGLISQTDSKGSSGAPGLSRIPFLGGAFGRQSQSKNRTEVVVLITPRVVRSPQQTRSYTDEYLERFEGMAPLRAPARD
ncbi:MAG: type II secretion system protein D [Silanimonas sp.]|nr:MAG: type II secretion system protein D [Silanimonas sp.]